MPPKSQAPVQQRDNGHKGHATEDKHRIIRQSKHDTLLICSMLTYNTIETHRVRFLKKTKKYD